MKFKLPFSWSCWSWQRKRRDVKSCQNGWVKKLSHGAEPDSGGDHEPKSKKFQTEHRFKPSWASQSFIPRAFLRSNDLFYNSETNVWHVYNQTHNFFSPKKLNGRQFMFNTFNMSICFLDMYSCNKLDKFGLKVLLLLIIQHLSARFLNTHIIWHTRF